jgi:hypothetical protein
MIFRASLALEKDATAGGDNSIVALKEFWEFSSPRTHFYKKNVFLDSYIQYYEY